MKMDDRIYKGDDKVFFGVCSGFAEHFKIDPLIIRVLLLILCFLTDTIAIFISIIYVSTAMIMPSKDDDNNDFNNYNLT